MNAGGTLNLLEAARRCCPEAPFIHMSTNKVYGDAPNRLNLVEEKTRWDFADPEYLQGIKETFPIDQSMHSPGWAITKDLRTMFEEIHRAWKRRVTA